jgi:DNA-binding transcriptional LysR family regulator
VHDLCDELGLRHQVDISAGAAGRGRTSTIGSIRRGARRSQGFSPRVENEPHSMQTILSLVEAEEGVAIVPASTSNLRSNGVQFVRLEPDLYLDLIVAWRLGDPSVVLRTFLDFLSTNTDAIRAKAELALSSIARIKS